MIVTILKFVLFLLGATLSTTRLKFQKMTSYAADSKRWTQIKSLSGRSVERNLLLQTVELREESLLGHCTKKRDKPKQITNDQRRNSGGFQCETSTVISSVYTEDLHFAYKVISLPSSAGYNETRSQFSSLQEWWDLFCKRSDSAS
jgi:hypothetical protein